MTVVGYILAVAAAYLVGSIPFGFLMGRVCGIDVRKHGSGNVGATNVARSLGIGKGLAVLALDALKGAAAVCLARYWLAGLFDVDPPQLMEVLSGAAVILGHVSTPWLRFRGGKGVGSALGVWLVLAPVPTLIALGVWIVLVTIWRYVSLGSIAAAVALPCALAAVNYGDLANSTPKLVFAALLAAMVIYTHRSNLRRLIAGTESKVSKRTEKEEAPDGDSAPSE